MFDGSQYQLTTLTGHVYEPCHFTMATPSWEFDDGDYLYIAIRFGAREYSNVLEFALHLREISEALRACRAKAIHVDISALEMAMQHAVITILHHQLRVTKLVTTLDNHNTIEALCELPHLRELTVSSCSPWNGDFPPELQLLHVHSTPAGAVNSDLISGIAGMPNKRATLVFGSKGRPCTSTFVMSLLAELSTHQGNIIVFVQDCDYEADAKVINPRLDVVANGVEAIDSPESFFRESTIEEDSVKRAKVI